MQANTFVGISGSNRYNIKNLLYKLQFQHTHSTSSLQPSHLLSLHVHASSEFAIIHFEWQIMLKEFLGGVTHSRYVFSCTS